MVRLRRGPAVESTHLVHAVVATADGSVPRSFGDPDRPTHPRSAVKPVQSLPLVESGAADGFGLDDVHLALACASHEGESGHVRAVEAWLDRIGCTVDDLECGVQAGRAPTPAANNCSGKHVGFLSVARHLGVDTRGYIEPEHPVQRLATGALADLAGAVPDPASAGVDGCGIPAPVLPLVAIARFAATFAAPPEGTTAVRRHAIGRLRSAMLAEPWFVAGTGRLCTDLLRAGGGEVVTKVGAEGVEIAGLPKLGVGIATKCEDGSIAAAEVALGWLLASTPGAPDVDAVFESRRVVRNHAGRVVAHLELDAIAVTP